MSYNNAPGKGCESRILMHSGQKVITNSEETTDIDREGSESTIKPTVLVYTFLSTELQLYILSFAVK
jgi:hypothetical protein